MKGFLTSSQKGLTVIELLLAAAVMAVIMVLLMPVLGKGRAHAASAGCVNHLRQIYTAYGQFVIDNSGHIPPYREFFKNDAGEEVRGATWSGQLLPYYNSTNPPARCPGERDAKVKTTYGMNALISSPEKMLAVPAPSKRFLITDAHEVIRITAAKFAEEASFRHPGALINLLFLDGHIESRTLESVPIPANGYPTTSREYLAFWKGTP